MREWRYENDSIQIGLFRNYLSFLSVGKQNAAHYCTYSSSTGEMFNPVSKTTRLDNICFFARDIAIAKSKHKASTYACIGKICDVSNKIVGVCFQDNTIAFGLCSAGAPFYYYGITWIPARIGNFIHYKVWDVITYPFINFNGCTVEV